MASPFPNRVRGAGKAAPRGWQGAYAELLDDLLYRLDGPLVAVRWDCVPEGTKKYTVFLEASSVRQLSDLAGKSACDLRGCIPKQAGREYFARLKSAGDQFGLDGLLSDEKV